MSSVWFKARTVLAAASIAATLTVAGSAAQAAKPSAPAGSCSVAGSVVNGTGLPTDQVINFLITDAGGTWGWVLGYSPDGTMSVPVQSGTGPTTYQFVSRTWGPNGSKYNVFASCGTSA